MAYTVIRRIVIITQKAVLLEKSTCKEVETVIGNASSLMMMMMMMIKPD